jgi:hypothetical protein
VVEWIEMGDQDTRPDSAPGLEPDPVIEASKKDIGRTLLRRDLKRSVTQRLANLIGLQRLAEEARRAERQSRSST